MDKFIVKPRGRVIVRSYCFDNASDPESTLSFELSLANYDMETFYWYASCWPFRIRNNRVDKFVNHGILPPHMDLQTVEGKLYNLRIDKRYCKYSSKAENRLGFFYYPIGRPNDLTLYDMSFRDSIELRWLLYNSYTGSCHAAASFKMRAFVLIMPDDTIYLEEDITLERLSKCRTIIGHTVRDSYMVAVPGKLFKIDKTIK